LIIASHGSWNRNPWIGYNLNAYTVDFASDPYTVSAQTRLLPALRGSSKQIRPVDVRTSPVNDGALLMTSDRDDLNAENGYAGGLYRVVGTSDTSSSNSEVGIARIPVASDFGVAPPAGVALDRLADIPCARQMTHSTVNPRLLYISTMDHFCRSKSGTGESIYVVELGSDSTVVNRGPVKIIENLNGPQGIDYSNGKMYIATNGNRESKKGNCLLEVADIDALAGEILAETKTSAVDGSSDSTYVSEVACGFTRTQWSHYWRSLRVSPSGAFAVVSIGADCNWRQFCNSDADVSKKELHTTLARVELTGSDKGTISIAARGIRNSLGLFFDENENLIFTSMGSDSAAGIAGAKKDNTPDCVVEVLRFNARSPVTSARTTALSLTNPTTSIVASWASGAKSSLEPVSRAVYKGLWVTFLVTSVLVSGSL